MIYTFDTEVAEIVGTDAAAIYQNIAFWCAKNKANGKHEHDGRYWTYNSMKAFTELFPWLSAAQVRRALKKLEDAGIIVTGCFNRSGYDRTKWYAVGEMGERFTPDAFDDSDNFHLTKLANGSYQNDKPIPDSKQQMENKDIYTQPAHEVIDYLNEKTGSGYRYSKASLTPIKARLAEGFTVEDCERVIDTKAEEWGGSEMERYLRPQTLFSASHFESYLNQKSAKKEPVQKWKSAAEVNADRERADVRRSLKVLLPEHGADALSERFPLMIEDAKRLGLVEEFPELKKF